MTVKDARKLIAVFMVTYPNYKPIDIELAATVWADATEEYSYEQVNMALKAYMKSSTSGFAPTPGQLIDKIHFITQPPDLNETEAWSLVSNAIRRSAYDSAEEYAKLPPLVQKAVGLPSQLRTWAIDEEYNEQVVSSNFMRAYRAEVAREKEVSKMPAKVRKLIQNAYQKSYKDQITEKRTEMILLSSERKESEIKALEAKLEGVPMPDRVKERLKEIRGAI